MLSLPAFKIRFTPTWKMSVLAAFSILLFSRLGYWQLQRAEEKKNMVSAHQSFLGTSPTSWVSGQPLPRQYQPIKVRGHFLSKRLLLDNQHYNHQFGYQVLSPLEMSDGCLVLVDRGWLQGDPSRQTLPQLDVPKGQLEIVGHAYYPAAKTWMVGQMIEKEQEKMLVIEYVDPSIIGQFLHKSVYPFIIRLGKEEASGYIREWAIVSMPPQRHYAYAFQWFAMAFVIFILFIVLNIKTKTDENSTA